MRSIIENCLSFHHRDYDNHNKNKTALPMAACNSGNTHFALYFCGWNMPAMTKYLLTSYMYET